MSSVSVLKVGVGRRGHRDLILVYVGGVGVNVVACLLKNQ
jgi:hypothetical protein